MVVFCVGVIVQACTKNQDYIFAGRFVTGLGVGSLSMIVPLYNAELAPPEIRGSLVAVQQLAITFGIMVSFWVSSFLSVACATAVLTDQDWLWNELHRWHWSYSV